MPLGLRLAAKVGYHSLLQRHTLVHLQLHEVCMSRFPVLISSCALCMPHCPAQKVKQHHAHVQNGLCRCRELEVG